MKVCRFFQQALKGTMHFSFAEADMNCGVENPAIAVSIVLSALLFGAWMARILASMRSPRRKALYLALVLGGSLIGSSIAQGFAVGMLAAETRAASDIPVLGVGCIERPPAFLSPAVTVLCALVLYAAWTLWRGVRQARANAETRQP